jgi:cytochrome b561
MKLRNSTDSYGLLSICLHWLNAVACVGLFILGWWMVGLDYYDRWYTIAPYYHKGVGILLFAVVIFWLAWRLFNTSVEALATSRIEHVAAKLAHWSLYLLLIAVLLSGYLISSADGRSIDVLGLFSVPATLTSLPEQETLAGNIHRILAWCLGVLVALHITAALKHHFVDRDRTLKRMLGITNNVHQ